jgi:hypothetical protein
MSSSTRCIFAVWPADCPTTNALPIPVMSKAWGAAQFPKPGLCQFLRWSMTEELWGRRSRNTNPPVHNFLDSAKSIYGDHFQLVKVSRRVTATDPGSNSNGQSAHVA